MSNTYTFKCVHCDHTVCEEVLDDAVVTSKFTDIEIKGDHLTINYSQIPSIDRGRVDRYQCAKCGETLKDEDRRVIHDLDGLLTWIEAYGTRSSTEETKQITVTVELVLRVPRETATQEITIDWPSGYRIKIDTLENGKSYQALVEGYTTIDCAEGVENP